MTGQFGSAVKPGLLLGNNAALLGNFILNNLTMKKPETGKTTSTTFWPWYFYRYIKLLSCKPTVTAILNSNPLKFAIKITASIL